MSEYLVKFSDIPPHHHWNRGTQVYYQFKLFGCIIRPEARDNIVDQGSAHVIVFLNEHLMSPALSVILYILDLVCKPYTGISDGIRLFTDSSLYQQIGHPVHYIYRRAQLM